MLRTALFFQLDRNVLFCKHMIKRCKHRQLVTKMFPSVGSELDVISGDKGSLSSILMQKHKMLQHASLGTHYYMPPLTRSLEKLTRIIDKEMRNIGAQKIVTPCLSPKDMWEDSGRWELMGSELFKVKDRNGSQFCLSPTHEEAVTSIVKRDQPLSYKRLPIKLYQIGKKFRDEMRPKHGLLRCREFEMKDLYTFDGCEEDAQKTFDEVYVAYTNILKKLDLPFITVEASTGAMGGQKSIEFQLLASAGEDKIYKCDTCSHGVNKELIGDDSSMKCPAEGCSGSLKEHVGIEVAHAFLLGTKYSKALKAKFVDQSGNKKHLVMGCYGVGVSRLLAASVEVLSSADKLRHSPILAPHQICIVPQKKGHRFEETWTMSQSLYDKLDDVPNLAGEVVLDDRVELSIGQRMKQASAAGYPYVVAVGKKALDSPEPRYELIDSYNGSLNEPRFLTLDELLTFGKNIQTVNINNL